MVLHKSCLAVTCTLGLLVALWMPFAAHSAQPLLEKEGGSDTAAKACVILLHGITKDSSSMRSIEHALQAQGYHTVNLDYPSRSNPIEVLAGEAIPQGLAACKEADTGELHFVAHSMGGLLVRYFYDRRDVSGVSSVVMLGTPNQGSRLGNFLSCIPWIKDLNGPAGKQMGVDRNSIPNRMGPVHFPLGVIAGTRTFNPLFAAIISGNDDGRVGLPSTYVEGACTRVTYPLTHDNLTDDQRVIDQVVAFLNTGSFRGDEVETFPCANPPRK
ncbi:alpha/beta fold hydrolase [Microbulbifer mangrovi]|uniref:alpha/beta fold hydrolase n=1 Tax=Microbulbifer mangrovi TaxID=927787 RepID=UPI00117EBC66|nr:alpha/beta fold hydrolase [Microbulbifer mangrovi]